MTSSRTQVDVWKNILIYALILTDCVLSTTLHGHKPHSYSSDTLALDQPDTLSVIRDKETREKLLEDVTKLEKQLQQNGVTIRDVSLQLLDHYDKLDRSAQESGEVQNLEKKWNKGGVRVWGKREEGENEMNDVENNKVNNNRVRESGEKEGKDNGMTLKSIANTGNTWNVANEKKWNRNGLKVWGKRSDEDTHVVRKKWNKNSVRIWGKRNSLDAENMATELEKKWNRNGVKVWGKRDAIANENEAIDVDKKWNRNGVKVWGKRTQERENEKASSEEGNNLAKKPLNQNNRDLENPEEINSGLHPDVGLAQNKKWNRNGVRVWGKRAEKGPGDRNNKQNNNQLLSKFKHMDDVSEQSEDIEGGGQKTVQTASLDKPSFSSDLVINNEPASNTGNNNINNSENNRFENAKRKWDNNKVRIWGKRSEESRRNDVLAGKQHHDKSFNTRRFTNTPTSFRTAGIDRIPDEHTTYNDDEELMTSSEFTSGLQSDMDSNREVITKTLPRTTPMYSSTLSHKLHRHKRSWREDVGWMAKRARSVRSNYNQPPEGPKRGWRTNVIRVWGKRAG